MPTPPVVADASITVSEEWIVVGDVAVAANVGNDTVARVAFVRIKTELKHFRTADGHRGQNIVVLRELSDLIKVVDDPSTCDTHRCRPAQD
jgi:hypothetical protein